MNISPTHATTIDNLAPEMVRHILSFLSIKDREIGMRVCNLWKHLITDIHFFEILQNFQAPGIAVDRKSVPFLRRMIPWNQASKDCRVTEKSIFKTNDKITAAVLTKDRLYWTTFKTPQAFIHTVEHGRKHVQTYTSEAFDSPIQCLEERDGVLYGASKRSIYKFEISQNGISNIGSHSFKDQIKQIRIVEPNKLLILGRYSHIYREQYPEMTQLIYFDCTTNTPLAYINLPPFACDIHYFRSSTEPPEITIVSLHTVSAHTGRSNYTRICSTSLNDGTRKEDMTVSGIYGKFTMCNDEVLTFWGNHGCGVLKKGENLHANCIINYKAPITFWSFVINRNPMFSQNLFSGLWKENVIVSTNGKIKIYSSDKQKIREFPISKKLLKAISLFQEPRRLLSFPNSLYFYTFNKRKVSVHYLGSS